MLVACYNPPPLSLFLYDLLESPYHEIMLNILILTRWYSRMLLVNITPEAWVHYNPYRRIVIYYQYSDIY
jgi:hypothetical protein